MSLDEFLSKKKKDSKEPPLKDETFEPPLKDETFEPPPKDETFEPPLKDDSITKSEPLNTRSSEDLWSILVETVKGDVVLFPNLKGYVQGKILPREPDISPKELASRLSISIGTAMVLLSELKSNSTSNDQ